MSHNRLLELPRALDSLPSLKKLSASHNQLSCSGLPDLSPLASLREVRLTGNPDLSRLPEHLARWGTADKGRGLEILELGGCGIAKVKDLTVLKGLDALHHLSIKGNPFAIELANDFESYKESVCWCLCRSKGPALTAYSSQIVKLIPSLRILDGHRFDPKFMGSRTKDPKGPTHQPASAPSSDRSSLKRKQIGADSSRADDRLSKRGKPSDPAAARMRAAEEQQEDEDDEEVEELSSGGLTPSAVPKERERRLTKAEKLARRTAAESVGHHDVDPPHGAATPALVRQSPEAGAVEPKVPKQGPPKKKRSRHNKKILRAGTTAPTRQTRLINEPVTVADTVNVNDVSVQSSRPRDATLYGSATLASLEDPDKTSESKRPEQSTTKTDESKRTEKAKTSVVKIVDLVGKDRGKERRSQRGDDDAVAFMLGNGSAAGSVPVGWD